VGGQRGGGGGNARKVLRQANSHGGDKANHRPLIGELSNSRSRSLDEYSNAEKQRGAGKGGDRKTAPGESVASREREII